MVFLETMLELMERTSNSIDISSYDTKGFCTNFPLRRHKFETEANKGSHIARQDWAKYIAPTDKFGGCNPVNAYILEYAFLYDNIIEKDSADNENTTRDSSMFSHHDSQPLNPALRQKQLQAKMILELTSMDKDCSARVLDVWKTMVTTTLRDKEKQFETLEEYVDFRIIDTGAPFVESVMLFGMGFTLTKDEDERLADVVYPCYAALGLANDYFSFDREYEEFKESNATTLTNAVWHYMQWQKLDIDAAKNLVRKAATEYEQQFLKRCDEFRETNAPIALKLDHYLIGLQHQISGNVIWSLNCPRYHPSFRYDANAGIENTLMAQSCEGSENNDHSRTSSISAPTVDAMGSVESLVTSRRSSATSLSSGTSAAEVESADASILPPRDKLDPELVQAPFIYTSSLPSKGLRDAFIDALNVWFNIDDEKVERIKWIIKHLHTASLMLDDIQDGSPLRRGKPAAHKVFGIAQTINSANLAIIEAINAARELQQPMAIESIIWELQSLHVGQGYDLYWTRHLASPSEEDYLEMVGRKTGGLFRLLARLMMADQFDRKVIQYIEDLVMLIGVHFQIRDDYQNLNSPEYFDQKGFCEDLDEGKFSLPLIHYLKASSKACNVRELLQSRRDSGSLSKEAKLFVRNELDQSGSMNYTKTKLEQFQRHIKVAMVRVEEETGRKNWVLRLFLEKLSV